jgi:NADH-quinone oxidoreductase subunit J
MTGELFLFAILAAISVICGIGMVLQDNPVRSALYLVGVLFSIAVLFLELHASFVAAIQVIVYAGAIMVLFIFVIMLLNLGAPDTGKNPLKSQNSMAVLAGIVLVVAIASAIMAIPQPSTPTMLPTAMTGAFEIGLTMFSPTWLFPFEAVSILLLIAVVGAVVLAKRRLN